MGIEKRKPVKNYFLYRFVKITGAFPSLFLAPKVIYADPAMKRLPKGKLLIIANHTDFWDVPTLLCAFWTRPIHFIATKDLFQTKLGSFFFRNMHCVEVDKDNISMSTIRESGELLKKGYPLAIFPEGQIQKDSTTVVSPFKSGVVLLAILNQAAILPILIRKKQGKRKKFLIVGTPVTIQTESSLPSVAAMNRYAEQLREKELELEEFYKENIQ